MKTAILIADGVKQIMFTPESENEKQALRLITPSDDVHTVTKTGSFASYPESKVFGANVYECQGGYYRAEQDQESVMFVLTPKVKERDETTPRH